MSIVSGKFLKSLVKGTIKQSEASFSSTKCMRFIYPKNPYINENQQYAVTKETLRKLEKLSMLTFRNDDEYINFFENNLKFVGKLMEVDTAGVDPMYTPLEDEELCLRDDDDVAPEPQMVDGILGNAVVEFEGYFVVPSAEESAHSNSDINKES